jgi:hypothetical protein
LVLEPGTNMPVQLLRNFAISGTDVMILKIFSPKNLAKNWRFYSKQSQILKKMIITLVFEKNANFFDENWQKSKKIVIITSTPGHTVEFARPVGMGPKIEKN